MAENLSSAETDVLRWFAAPQNSDKVLPRRYARVADALIAAGRLRYVDHGGDDPWIEVTEAGRAALTKGRSDER